MTKPTDKVQSEPQKDITARTVSRSETAKGNKRDEQHFWRALKKDDEIQTLHKPSPDRKTTDSVAKPAAPSQKPIDLTVDTDDLSLADRESRRRALRSMLAANEARQQSALRARRPTPEAGLRVGVRNGPFKGKEGTILDADYIKSRVLLDMEEQPDAQWVEFAHLYSLIKD